MVKLLPLRRPGADAGTDSSQGWRAYAAEISAIVFPTFDGESTWHSRIKALNDDLGAAEPQKGRSTAATGSLGRRLGEGREGQDTVPNHASDEMRSKTCGEKPSRCEVTAGDCQGQVRQGGPTTIL